MSFDVDCWVGSGDETFTLSISSVGKDVHKLMRWMWNFRETGSWSRVSRECFISSFKMQEVEWNVTFSAPYYPTQKWRGTMLGCLATSIREGRQPIPSFSIAWVKQTSQATSGFNPMQLEPCGPAVIKRLKRPSRQHILHRPLTNQTLPHSIKHLYERRITKASEGSESDKRAEDDGQRTHEIDVHVIDLLDIFL